MTALRNPANAVAAAMANIERTVFREPEWDDGRLVIYRRPDGDFYYWQSGIKVFCWRGWVSQEINAGRAVVVPE